MTDICEGSTIRPAEQKKPRTDGKLPLNIRLALLYDGTLNNRTNIAERESNTAIYQTLSSKKRGSYDNGRTNIAILEQHVKGTAGDYNIFFKFYIEGQGTLDLKGDVKTGYVLGGGETGVADRALKGIESAVTKIKKNGGIDKDQNYIEKLTIDVLGFSRGAAAARYAIHLLLKGRKRISKRLRDLGYDIEDSAVEVCFAGLFDTVLSYYGSQYFESSNNVLQQRAVALAKKAVHLAAADEHRLHFPLHNIKGTKCKGGEEYFLPGVHSDVGGSYNKANEKLLEHETEESKKIYMLTTEEDMLINWGDHQDIEADRKYLIKQGWYKEHEITVTPSLHGKASLTVKRESIRTAYCNIPLKIMADFARKPSVNLKIDEKLEDRASAIFNKEPENGKDLTALEKKIRSYIASNKNSRPEDWINDPTLKEIRHTHLHFSAEWDDGYFPRIISDKNTKQPRRKRYEYDA